MGRDIDNNWGICLADELKNNSWFELGLFLAYFVDNSRNFGAL